MGSKEWSKKNKVYAWRPKEKKKKKKKPKKDLKYSRTDTKTSHVTTNKAKPKALPMSTLKTPTKAAEKPKSTLKKIGEGLLKGPELPEGSKLETGTLPIGPAGIATAGRVTSEVFKHGLKGGKLVGMGGRTFQRGFKSTKELNKDVLKLFKASTNIRNAGGVAVNGKTLANTNSMLSKVFSMKSLAILGGAASSMFLGQWAQAEAGEPLSIVMRDIAKEAQQTGDWTLYNEAKEARDEILDINKWEQMLLNSPLSPIEGIYNKIHGVTAAAEVLDKLAKDIQIQQETGETDDEKWARIKQEERDQDKAEIDYYNSERKKLVAWETEAKAAGDKKSAALWRNERALQSKKEKEDREAIAKFWMAYRKEMQKISEDSRPSKLNFGLL